MNVKKVIITSGEPAGIGPDLLVKISQKSYPINIVACIDQDLLLQRANKIGLPIKILKYDPNSKVPYKRKYEISVLHIPIINSVSVGHLNPRNSKYVINTIDRAILGCINKEFSALITGPVHKGILNESNFSFMGHTEYLSEKLNSFSIMMLINRIFKVALVTTHIPLNMVSKKINKSFLSKVIHNLIRELKDKLKIYDPEVWVCGLNPHSGENGYIGDEEVTTIIPVIEKLKKKYRYNLVGPVSPDSIFIEKKINKSKIILSMYHDQSLPVIKYDGFDKVVNVTLGLPFLRASVGHGTALNLAGTYKVCEKSMDTAIKFIINNI